MLQFFDMLNANTTWWDVIEFKLIIFFITVGLAVWIVNKLHNKKDRDQ